MKKNICILLILALITCFNTTIQTMEQAESQSDVLSAALKNDNFTLAIQLFKKGAESPYLTLSDAIYQPENHEKVAELIKLQVERTDAHKKTIIPGAYSTIYFKENRYSTCALSYAIETENKGLVIFLSKHCGKYSDHKLLFYELYCYSKRYQKCLTCSALAKKVNNREIIGILNDWKEN